jgi:ectoine hydroxylase
MSETAINLDNFVMDEREQAFYRANGYLVREAAFSPRECEQIVADCEQLLADLEARRPAQKQQSGSHPVNVLEDLGLTIKWEREFPDKIRGIEPFAHVCPPLNAWAYDPRLTAPCLYACGAEEVVLFTEKLHTKRARAGGEIEPHQDFPYWEGYAPHAAQVVTAMLYLDDATVANGCLEIVPASHRGGLRPMRGDASGIDSKRMDPARFDTGELTPVEAPAGSILFFDAFLVHRSGANRSDKDRRALLYSYQPAGFPHSRELRKLAIQRR